MQGNNRTILVQHLAFLLFNSFLFCICCSVIQHKRHSLNKKKQDRQMGVENTEGKDQLGCDAWESHSEFTAI